MTDIRDIRPPVPYGMVFPWWLAAAVAAALLLATAAFWWHRRRRRTQPAAPPPLPPEEVALAGLAALAREPAAADKVFYTRLSALLRTYLGARFGLEALEKTTEELLPALRGLPVGADQRGILGELLRFADPVKYADAAAGPERRASDLRAAEAFVRAAGPSPKEPA